MAERIGSILPSRLRHYHVHDVVTSAQIVSVFGSIIKQVLPAELADRVRAVSSKEGIIYCKVDHPAVAQECMFRQKLLLYEMRKKMPHARITHVRFRM